MVWDFDLSLLLEANTDTWIVKRFSLPAYDALRRTEQQWTDAMDAALGSLADRGVTPEAQRSAFAELPFQNAGLVKRLHEGGGVTQVIVSDANSLFIEWLLSIHGLAHCFDRIVTNPAAVVGDRVRVRHFHRNDACSLCPVNLCKGAVLQAYLRDHPGFARVFYVGDGRGDFHPCTLPGVRPLARRGFPLSALLTESRVEHDCWEGAAELEQLLLPAAAVAGVVVLIRSFAKDLAFLYVRDRGGRVVELQVRSLRVPKRIKLGDEIEAVGCRRGDGDAVFCSATVPRVVRKYDPGACGQFTPQPGAKCVSRSRVEKPPVDVACRYWLSDSKCARLDAGICRFLHPVPGSDEFLQARRERLAALERARSLKVHDAEDPHAGAKARRSQRAQLFAAWILRTFGRQGCVLDVAGGKGELSRELLSQGVCERVLLVDPRCDLHKCPPGLVHRKEPFGSEWSVDGERIDLVVGMHIDEVTEPAIEWFVLVLLVLGSVSRDVSSRAVAKKLPFAVVPCCVFVEMFPREGRVTTYEQLLVWLVERFGAAKDFLPLQGRNVVIHSQITCQI